MDDALDAALAAAQKAAKEAKRAAALTVLAVAVAVLVLLIDNGIKRAVLAAAQAARETLDEHRDLLARHVIQVRIGTDGDEAAGETGAPADGGSNGPDGVVHDPATGSAVGEAADPGGPAPAGRAAGAARGTRGDGGRARRT